MKLVNDLFFADHGLMNIIGIAMAMAMAMAIGGGATALAVLRRKMRLDPPEGRKIRS